MKQKNSRLNISDLTSDWCNQSTELEIKHYYFWLFGLTASLPSANVQQGDCIVSSCTEKIKFLEIARTPQKFNHTKNNRKTVDLSDSDDFSHTIPARCQSAPMTISKRVSALWESRLLSQRAHWNSAPHARRLHSSALEHNTKNASFSSPLI